jgi:hypothetical protein
MPAGTPITLPPPEPTPLAVTFTNWEQQLAAERWTETPMSAVELGRLRVEVLRQIVTLDDKEAQPSADLEQGLYQLAAETLRTVALLSRKQPRPTLLWAEELDVATFMGRTLLLADHIILADQVFATLLRDGNVGRLGQAAEEQLKFADLLSSGLAIPVASGVAMAVRGQMTIDLTRRDLEDLSLVSWVRDQLILEGPTAREVRAADDLSMHLNNLWLNGRIDRDWFFFN